MPETHKRFGGSSAHRWMACPASIQLGEKAPRSPSGAAAHWGTVCHAVAERILKGQPYHEGVLGDDAKLVDDEMLACARLYVAACLEIGRGGEIEVPLVIPGTDAGDDIGGTADYLYYDAAEKALWIVDLKSGRAFVDEDSEQLKFYALAAYLMRDDEIRVVNCTIVQPRALNVDHVGAVRTHTFSAADLMAFYDEIQEAVSKALEPAPEAIPGDHCRYCDARALCPIYEAVALDPLKIHYDGQVYLAPEKLDVEHLAAIMKQEAVVIGWFNAIREYAESKMLNGELVIPGLKVVEKIGRRKITSNAEDIVSFAAEFFIPKDDVMPPVLLGVTALEKLLKANGADKDDMQRFYLDHTLKESSGLTVAPVSDKREAVVLESPEVNFNGLEGLVN